MFFVMGKRHGRSGGRVAVARDDSASANRDVAGTHAREARRVAALDRFMKSRQQLLLFVDGCQVPDLRPPEDSAGDED